MALAEPALRQFGVYKLKSISTRGGSLLGTAIGTAIGIGYSLTKDWQVTFPWSSVEQPRIPNRSFVGNASIFQKENAGAYQYNQALRTSQPVLSRNKYTNKKSRHRCCCTQRCGCV